MELFSISQEEYRTKYPEKYQHGKFSGYETICIRFY